MTPNFALSLSFEGISLLCRVQTGWRVVSEVALSAEDLAGELEAIRKIAQDRDGADFRTKLILPNDQIKYLTIETGRGSQGKRLTAAKLALEAETPYSADQLALDISADGRNTHVAAVARETLVEAEAFAVEHQFNPVCFVAIPDHADFPKEPQFGETVIAGQLLGGQKLEADSEIIVVTGHGFEPEPEQPEQPEPEEAQAESPEIVSDTPDTPKFSIPPAPADLTPEAPEPEPSDAVEATVPDSSKEPASQEDPQPVAPAGFSSIRAHRDDVETSKAPEIGAARIDVSGTNAPGLPPALDDSAHSETSLRFDPAKVVESLKSDTAPSGVQNDRTTGSRIGAFLSRRASDNAPATEQPVESASEIDPIPLVDSFVADVVAEPPKQPVASSERRNMAIFGARDGEIGGKPRHLGLVLTVALLLFLAGVAIWATLFLEDGVAGLLRRDPVPQIAELEMESKPTEDVAPEADAMQTEALAPVELGSLTDSAEIESMTDDAVASALFDEDPLDLTDSAAVEAMVDGTHPKALTENEAEARYAVNGIWERAPQQPDTPTAGSTESLYVTSIDRLLAVRDAVALPEETTETRDWAMPRQTTPPPQGTTYDFDERGLVRATAKGAMSPDGVMVYLGKPAVLPKSFPERKPAPGESFTPQMIIKLGKLRPKLRPDDLIEKNERASYGGRTLQELVLKRPRLRPALAKAEEEKDTTPTKAAVVASVRPRPRPTNFSQIIARATPSDPVVASPIAASVSPKIPSSASVARQATIQNAINLNKINLIGVYGTSSSRRALVRMSNGRYKKVQVGDRIDGGKVAAISDTELRYVKSGKNVVLKLPKG